MRNFLLIIIAAVFLTGCGTTLKSNWRNFNAYYNTYHNAKESYRVGLQKNLNQQRDYNPLQPIRIHHIPVNAGGQEFEKTIQKGADILRKYSDTKWVDNALFLIGKSYYYRREYFSADQKFKELYVTTDKLEMKQKSVVWQGRVLLEMEVYNEGIAFLNEQLAILEEEGEWEKEEKAELRAVLAQHHVQLGNWQSAADELSAALPDLDSKEHQERGYFLLGQVYEELENLEAAFEAYEKVSNYYVEYRVQYLAQRKKADMARRLDRDNVAYNIFNRMVRDDKNLEYKAELDFELAQTDHERGNFKNAEKLYNRVLRNQLHKAPPAIRAQTYYGLAEIYRFAYDNFSRAAAYYDSAAQQNVPAERLPRDFDAGELAESFGEYARLRSEIALQDSLLHLGQMSQQEFDSALAEIKKQRLEELKKQQEARREMQNQIVNTNRGEQEEDATSLDNGFLNEDDPVLQEEARTQFYAIWGQRPLADNWRVAELISEADIERAKEEGELGAQQGELTINRIQIDLSAIPFEPTEQDSVRKRIASYQYQLGNLFFLSLNMPDSAVHYFNKAIENPSNENVNMVSLYSLSELYDIQENQQQARFYARQLSSEYPGTNYANRVSQKYGFDMAYLDESDAVNPVQLYEKIHATDSLLYDEKATRLRTFAQNFSTHPVAARAYFEAIQLYAKAGKNTPGYEQKQAEWMRVNREWKEKQETFTAQKDSARTMLNDTTITDAQADQYQALVDSTLQEPDLSEYFPYQGASWDSTRAYVNGFLELFESSKYKPAVTRLKNEIAIPEKSEPQLPRDMEEEAETQSASQGEYVSCQELQTELSIRGGMEAFLGSIGDMPEAESDSITYRFWVNQRGIIDRYELQTSEASSVSGVSETFNIAIEEGLTFEPVLQQGKAVPVVCDISFPLKN